MVCLKQDSKRLRPMEGACEQGKQSLPEPRSRAEAAFSWMLWCKCCQRGHPRTLLSWWSNIGWDRVALTMMGLSLKEAKSKAKITAEAIATSCSLWPIRLQIPASCSQGWWQRILNLGTYLHESLHRARLDRMCA